MINLNTLEKTVENTSSFSFRIELKELTKSGLVNFTTKKYSTINSFWNSKTLTLPSPGTYKISWGFDQNAFKTFYNNDKTELCLFINNKEQKEKAIITRETPSFYAKKAAHKTVTVIVKEKESISLNAKSLFSENLKLEDVYLDVIKL
jgi:hypothetical protein